MTSKHVFKIKNLLTGKLGKLYRSINVARAVAHPRSWFNPEEHVIVEYELIEVAVHPCKKESK